jgi:hypothetical protein
MTWPASGPSGAPRPALGQVEVGAKTENPLFTALLDRIEVIGAVITADALHAQREHARYLARRRQDRRVQLRRAHRRVVADERPVTRVPRAR